MIEISVIIPTYKDWNRLSLCLESLDKQTIPHQVFEVIVVNNSPEDDPPPGYELPQNAKIIKEAAAGSYSARNAGLDVAKGEFIAFTDSDCIPDANWLKAAKELFASNGVDRVAGNILIFYSDINNKSAAELYESVFAFQQKSHVEKYKASVTANLIVRRTIFDVVGKFDSQKLSGEDFGWNMRASSLNFNIVYCPDIIVYHPARRTITELILKTRRVFGGKKKFDLRSIKGIAKEFIYLPYIFFRKTVPDICLVIINKTGLSLTEKIKVVYVVIVLYLALAAEYFRLLTGFSPIR